MVWFLSLKAMLFSLFRFNMNYFTISFIRVWFTQSTNGNYLFFHQLLSYLLHYSVRQINHFGTISRNPVLLTLRAFLAVTIAIHIFLFMRYSDIRDYPNLHVLCSQWVMASVQGEMKHLGQSQTRLLWAKDWHGRVFWGSFFPFSLNLQ